MTNLEPTIAQAFSSLVSVQSAGMSTSEYIRKLIIEELQRTGLLPDNLLTKILT